MITKKMKDMTPEERSAHMKAVRAHLNPQKAGLANVSKDKIKAISRMGVKAREKNSPQAEDSTES